PTEIMQLLPYVEAPIDAEMLSRYQVIRSGDFDEMPRGVSLIGEIAAGPGPRESVVRITKTSSSVTNVPDAATGDVERAIDAFAREHRGAAPAQSRDL